MLGHGHDRDLQPEELCLADQPAHDRSLGVIGKKIERPRRVLRQVARLEEGRVVGTVVAAQVRIDRLGLRLIESGDRPKVEPAHVSLAQAILGSGRFNNGRWRLTSRR